MICYLNWRVKISSSIYLCSSCICSMANKWYSLSLTNITSHYFSSCLGNSTSLSKWLANEVFIVAKSILSSSLLIITKFLKICGLCISSTTSNDFKIAMPLLSLIFSQEENAFCSIFICCYQPKFIFLILFLLGCPCWFLWWSLIVDTCATKTCLACFHSRLHHVAIIFVNLQ